METNDEILNLEKQKLDKLLFENKVSPYSVFRGIDAYFHNQQDLERYSFTFMSGRPIENFNVNVDYVIVNDNITAEDLDKYKSQITNENRENSTFIVSNKWILDCFKNQRLLPIQDYVV